MYKYLYFTETCLRCSQRAENKNQRTTGPEDMLKSAIIEEKKFKNIQSDWTGPRSMNDLDWPLVFIKPHVLILADCIYQLLYHYNYNSFWKIHCFNFFLYKSIQDQIWLGRAMVLGSFQCRGILLLWHMVGQGPALLAAGAGRVGCIFFFFFHLVYPFFLF